MRNRTSLPQTVRAEAQSVHMSQLMRERCDEGVRFGTLGSAAAYGCWEAGRSGSSLLLVRPTAAILRGDWLGELCGDLLM